MRERGAAARFPPNFMSDQPPESSPQQQQAPPSKDQIKREVLEEIAKAIQQSGKEGDGSSSKRGDEKGEKKEGDDKKPADKERGDAKKEEGDKKNGNGAKKKFRWTPLKVIILAVILLVVVVVAIRYFTYAAGHETTDDAYTTGYVHQISSRITSNVTELLVQDNERVHQGQVLLKLDPRDFVVAVARAKANYENAKADYDRVEPLRGDVAISKQDFDQSATNLEVARANLDDAENQLSYCTIVAPTDGYIGNRTVDTGNRVTVGGALMTVVQDVWIVANYKETQIGKMRRNQRVDITIDAIPKQKFVGRIDSFSPGTGSTFALLPPDNATGNFTKIVQRVPIKIIFDPDSIRDFRSRLLPGLSVETSTVLDDNVRPTADQAGKLGTLNARGKKRSVPRNGSRSRGVMLGAFMAVLDIQITNSSLKDIAGAIGSSIDEGSWISTAYLVAEIVIIGVSGTLASIFSLKRYLLFSAIGFLIFSVACAFCRDLSELIICRALQGITGGALIPLAFSTILLLLPRSKQSIGTAIFGFTATFGPSIGPSIGGWLTDNYGWEWIFFINIPPGLALIFIIMTCLRSDPMHLEKIRDLDYFGIATMAIGLGSLEYVLEEGERKDWFGNVIIYRFAWIAGIFIVLFFIRELTAKKPFLNLGLFRYRTFSLSCIMMTALGLGLYGTVFIMPEYLASVQGYSATEIGTTMMWGRHTPALHFAVRAAAAQGCRYPHRHRLWRHVLCVELLHECLPRSRLRRPSIRFCEHRARHRPAAHAHPAARPRHLGDPRAGIRVGVRAF